MSSGGFVWIVIGRRGPVPRERYVVAVYGDPAAAIAQAQRFRRQHPTGDVTVERYTVLNGAGLAREEGKP